MEPNAEATRTRRRPAIVPTLAAIAAIALFVTAGNWQRGRMMQKEALGAQFAAAAAQPAAAFPRTDDWTAWRYRTVLAVGTFDPAKQILLDNRIHNGRAGYDVVAPLALADGRTVLVDRGWVPGGATRADVPEVPVPTGSVEVRGRINMPPGAYLELAPGTVAGRVWQNLDLRRYADAMGVAVAPVIVEQTAPAGATDVLVRDWPAPDFGVDKHRMYMLQWYAFAATTAALWLYYTLRRRR
jgi:surfeit locus 1 family protein